MSGSVLAWALPQTPDSESALHHPLQMALEHVSVRNSAKGKTLQAQRIRELGNACRFQLLAVKVTCYADNEYK